MTTKAVAEDAQDPIPPKLRGPLKWEVRGRQNNWDWKTLPGDSIDVEYQTRFPEANLAEVYRGSSASAPLLATMKIDHFDAEITFQHRTPIPMPDTAQSGTMSNLWSIQIPSLTNRTLHWEYEHPVFGDNDAQLLDPATGETLGYANDNVLALYQQMPEAAVEELVVFGTAAQMTLVGALSHNDMTIVMMGPEGRESWIFQEPGWWEREENGEEEDEEEMERVEEAMLAAGRGGGAASS